MSEVKERRSNLKNNSVFTGVVTLICFVMKLATYKLEFFTAVPDTLPFKWLWASCMQRQDRKIVFTEVSKDEFYILKYLDFNLKQQ